MPLDPQIAAMLSHSEGVASARSMPPAQLRALVRQYADAFPRLDVPLASIIDQDIPGPAGMLPVRIYTPPGSGPYPIIVYFHGGGFVVGDLETQDMICRGLSHAAQCLVVSVDYRLAPEHPFPAGVDDAYAATAWVAAHAPELGGDGRRIAVAGDSAGAVLSAAVALRVRAEGGPALVAQVLFYGSMGSGVEAGTASAREFADGAILTADDMDYFWSQYVDERNRSHPYAAPARARDHRGLPPAFVGTAEIDPARDAAEAYGDLLQAAGVEVERHRYEGMPHGFLSWLGVVPKAQLAIDDVSRWLSRYFAVPGDRT